MGACRVPPVAKAAPAALPSSRERRRLGVTALTRTAWVIPGSRVPRAFPAREASRAHQDCGDPRGHLGPSAPQAFLERLAHPDCPVSRGNVALPGLLEPKGSRDLQGSPATPARRVPPAFPASKVSEATWAPLGRKGNWDPPAWTASQVPQGQRDRGASVGSQAVPARRGTRVSRASLASRGHRAPRASQGRSVRLGHRGLRPRRAARACVAPRGCQGPLDPLDPRASRAPLAWKDWTARTASQGCGVTPDHLGHQG